MNYDIPLLLALHPLSPPTFLLPHGDVLVQNCQALWSYNNYLHIADCALQTQISHTSSK